MGVTTSYEVRVFEKGKIKNRNYAYNVGELLPLVRDAQGKKCKVFKIKKATDGTIIDSEELKCRLYKNTFIIKSLKQKPIRRRTIRPYPELGMVQKPAPPRPAVNDLSVPQIVIISRGRRRVLRGEDTQRGVARVISGGSFRDPLRGRSPLTGARIRQGAGGLLRSTALGPGINRRSAGTQNFLLRETGGPVRGRLPGRISSNNTPARNVGRTSRNPRDSRPVGPGRRT